MPPLISLKSYRSIGLAAVALLVAAVLIYGEMTGRLDRIWQSIVNEETHIPVLITFYVLLPLVGFPINVFLLMLGVKFNTVTGIGIMCGGMAIHLSLSFLAANSFLRPRMEKNLRKTGISLPQFSQKGYIIPGIIFMSVPGLSYAMKNYIFALSGIPFRYYFIIGFSAQALLGVPVVVAGDLIKGSRFWFVTILFLMMTVGYIFYKWRRMKKID